MYNMEPGRSSKIIDEGLACRLHVSNLPFIFREAHLARLFSPFGIVADAEVITNEKGSKGFGFVSLSSPDEAASAQSEACAKTEGSFRGLSPSELPEPDARAG